MGRWERWLEGDGRPVIMTATAWRLSAGHGGKPKGLSSRCVDHRVAKLIRNDTEFVRCTISLARAAEAGTLSVGSRALRAAFLDVSSLNLAALTKRRQFFGMPL